MGSNRGRPSPGWSPDSRWHQMTPGDDTRRWSPMVSSYIFSGVLWQCDERHPTVLFIGWGTVSSAMCQDTKSALHSSAHGRANRSKEKTLNLSNLSNKLKATSSVVMFRVQWIYLQQNKENSWYLRNTKGLFRSIQVIIKLLELWQVSTVVHWPCACSRLPYHPNLFAICSHHFSLIFSSVFSPLICANFGFVGVHLTFEPGACMTLRDLAEAVRSFGRAQILGILHVTRLTSSYIVLPSYRLTHFADWQIAPFSALSFLRIKIIKKYIGELLHLAMTMLCIFAPEALSHLEKEWHEPGALEEVNFSAVYCISIQFNDHQLNTSATSAKCSNCKH